MKRKIPIVIPTGPPPPIPKLKPPCCDCRERLDELRADARALRRQLYQNLRSAENVVRTPITASYLDGTAWEAESAYRLAVDLMVANGIKL